MQFAFLFCHPLDCLQFYAGGLMDIPNCSRTSLTHAMLLTGYGTYGGKDYWLLKNRYEGSYIAIDTNGPV